jgi:hypothetical protein
MQGDFVEFVSEAPLCMHLTYSLQPLPQGLVTASVFVSPVSVAILAERGPGDLACERDGWIRQLR